jgi:hypothetical protein
MRYVIAYLISLAIMIAGCGKDSSTGPSSPEESLLLSRLVVSMVPGASDSVMICRNNPSGSPVAYSISNSDPSVASVTITDSTMEIRGLALGTTDITVSTQSGTSCTVPVQVYDPFILDTGELLITFTDDFEFIIDGGFPGFCFWKPIPPEGFHILGSWGQAGYNDPNGNKAMIVVKAKPGSDALVYTYDFDSINEPSYEFVWKPIPPPGYVAMGDVVVSQQGSRPDSALCVREDLTVPGSADTILTDPNNVYGFSLWGVDIPDVGPHSRAYLAAGTFLFAWNNIPPLADRVMNVLRVDLPMLAEAPYQNFVPKLDSYDTPPDETAPMMAKAMLVPCSIINDLAYSGNTGWQVANSPFYRLERQVYYKRLYHNHNQTSQTQTNSVTIRSGITTTESQRVWSETSISLTVEAGVSFQAFSGKISATVSRTFGYETQTSVAELQEREVSTSINTPPGKAASLWQQYNRYVLYRHNGTDLEPVSEWEFGIDSYVTDEYPD